MSILPWSTDDPREGMRDTDDARIMGLAPSWNLTPVGNAMVAVPYPVMDYAGHDEGYAVSVRFTGQRAMTLKALS